MSKKGFQEILFHIDKVGSMHYNEVLRYAFEQHLIESRASVTTMLNSLTGMGLLDRTVMTNTKPIRTTYKLSKKGRNILHHLREIETEMKNSN